MRVLHLIDHFGLGGAQTVVKGILTSDKEQDCFSLRSKKNQTTKIENVYFSKSNLKLNVRTLYEIKELIIKNNYSILHCHLFGAYIFGYILKRIRFPDFKLVYHEHGRIFKNKWLYNFFLKHTQNKVDLFIAVSAATKKRLIENVGIPEGKIKILYNFVDLDNFNPKVLEKYDRNSARAKIGIDKEDFVIGFAGRLVKTKGWEELIKSAKIISEENLKLKFLIVGNGPDKQKLINLIYKLDLSDKVFYIGFVPDIRFFYSMIDCFAMPSHWEPSPMIFYEVQALGIPFICADAISVNELARDKENALLFKPKDEADLVEKIRVVYSDEKIRNCLVECELKSIKSYSLDTYLEQLHLVYKDLRGGN